MPKFKVNWMKAQGEIAYHKAGPDGSFVSTGACNLGVPGLNPGRVRHQKFCHRGCAHTAHQTVQRHGVYSAAYGIVHYKEPLEHSK